MNIARNFTWKEIAGSSGLTERTANPRTVLMAGALALTLQTIRDSIGGHPIRITGGMRTVASSANIAASGGAPSSTSDHFFAENPAIPLSVGAVDIISAGPLSTWEFFNRILMLKYNGIIQTGQLLLEHNPDTGSTWVHLANDPRLLLSSADLAKRSANSVSLVAMSPDNGKTFKAIEQGRFWEG